MTLLIDLLICLRFFSRLPVPATRREIALGARGFAAAAGMAPLAGAVIALAPIMVTLAALAAELPPAVAAPLALASLVALTGALHEDALADCADGFGGGRTRERKLAIMRDSRIGAFGAVALALTLFIRAATLTAILVHGTGAAVLALLAAAALSRAACLVPLGLLPPARADGVGAGAGPGARGLATAAVVVLLGAVLAAACGAGVWRSAVAVATAAASALGVTALARRQIGGQTGDVAGAAQQLAETAVLLVFSAGLHPAT